jgi:hypothetical protein
VTRENHGSSWVLRLHAARTYGSLPNWDLVKLPGNLATKEHARAQDACDSEVQVEVTYHSIDVARRSV